MMTSRAKVTRRRMLAVGIVCLSLAAVSASGADEDWVFDDSGRAIIPQPTVVRSDATLVDTCFLDKVLSGLADLVTFPRGLMLLIK